MAATVSAWGKPGAWALDAEENEAELLEQNKEDSTAAETADFPSLSAAANTKAKKKKPQKISLQEFSGYTAPKPAAQPKGLTPDEMMLLPTGPRERSAEELDRNKLGGGFRSYGSRDEQPRRQGSSNRDSSREFMPSRADETDDWGAGKKFSSSNSFDRKERGERGGAFFSDSQSRADDVDNWASNKSYVPSEPRRNERRGGFGLESSNGGADSSNWGKRKEEEGRKTGGAFDSLRERRGGGSESNGGDSASWGRKIDEASGGARPKLNLQPRTLPVTFEEPKSEIASVDKSKSEIGSEISAVRPKGSNPFGEARPREEVLKEKGQDWKEIEEKLDSVKIKEAVSDGKKGFWSGNGRERLQQESRNERAWRRPELVDSLPESAAETDNGPTEKNKDGNGEEAEEKDYKM